MASTAVEQRQGREGPLRSASPLAFARRPLAHARPFCSRAEWLGVWSHLGAHPRFFLPRARASQAFTSSVASWRRR